MSKLIAVEYNPASLPGKKPTISPIVGCIGETSKRLLNQALQQLRNQDPNKPRSKDILVPVRFPICGVNSNIRFFMNGRDPEDEVQLMQEGEMLTPFDLFPISRKPVSLYEGSRLKSLADLGTLFESESYLETFSQKRALDALMHLSTIYPKAWVWYLEQDSSRNLKNLFFKARFYGIDTLINTYDPSGFSGVVLELTSRQWPDKSLRDKGAQNLPLRNDVFFFANTDEYTATIDGVNMHRTKTSYNDIILRVSDMMSAQEALPIRNTPESYEKKSKESMSNLIEALKAKSTGATYFVSTKNTANNG